MEDKSIRVVAVVSALPSPGVAGRVVRLSTDNNLYYDNGTSWLPLNYLENRTSDPPSPVTGQMWLRTDL